MKKYQYTVEADTATEFFLLLIIGTLEALKQDKLTVEAAEWYIFTPFLARTLRKYGHPKELTDLIDEGAELEDIISLIPHEYSNTLDNLLNRALTMLGEQKKEFKECPFKVIDE